jgi:hypothetical protein
MSLHSALKEVAQPKAAAPRRFSVPRNVWLSSATLLVVLAIWWVVTALNLISPLFLPAPQQVLHQLITIASPQGFMDATLWQHLAASLGRILVALLAAVIIGVPVGYRHGIERHGARHSRSAYRTVPPGAAAGVFAANGDLVRHRRNFEDPADLSGDFRPGGAVRTWPVCAAWLRCGCARRSALGASKMAGAALCGAAERVAGDPDGYPYWAGGRLVDAGRG